MKTREIRKAAVRLRIRYGLKKISLKGLKKAVQELGYTIIEFDSCENDEDISSVIERLDLGEYIARLKGFTYSDAEYHLVFVNKYLNEYEKILLLSHEAGHILCGHMARGLLSGSSVEQEDEANQFSYFLLHPNIRDRIKICGGIHKRGIAAAAAAGFITAGLLGYYCYARQQELYYGEFYVTDSGERYHKKECIFIKNKKNVRRLTDEELEKGQYGPCQICLPD